MAQRSCAGCKKKGEKAEFIRLCMKGDKLIIDENHSEDGRGAYLCNDISCMEKAIAKRAIQRTLRSKISPSDLEEIKSYLGGK